MRPGFWGFVGGGSLLIGAVIGLFVPASKKAISIVMALGAGVLISSVAFELMDAAFREGGFDAASVGLLLGAVLFYIGDQIIENKGGKHRKRSQGQQAGGSSTAILLGALMDGIPESIAIGASPLQGGEGRLRDGRRRIPQQHPGITFFSFRDAESGAQQKIYPFYLELCNGDLCRQLAIRIPCSGERFGEYSRRDSGFCGRRHPHHAGEHDDAGGFRRRGSHCWAHNDRGLPAFFRAQQTAGIATTASRRRHAEGDVPLHPRSVHKKPPTPPTSGQGS